MPFDHFRFVSRASALAAVLMACACEAPVDEDEVPVVAAEEPLIRHVATELGSAFGEVVSGWRGLKDFHVLDVKRRADATFFTYYGNATGPDFELNGAGHLRRDVESVLVVKTDAPSFLSTSNRSAGPDLTFFLGYSPCKAMSSSIFPTQSSTFKCAPPLPGEPAVLWWLPSGTAMGASRVPGSGPHLLDRVIDAGVKVVEVTIPPEDPPIKGAAVAPIKRPVGIEPAFGKVAPEWNISHDFRVLDVERRADELDFTYYGNATGSDFRLFGLDKVKRSVRSVLIVKTDTPASLSASHRPSGPPLKFFLGYSLCLATSSTPFGTPSSTFECAPPLPGEPATFWWLPYKNAIWAARVRDSGPRLLQQTIDAGVKVVDVTIPPTP